LRASSIPLSVKKRSVTGKRPRSRACGARAARDGRGQRSARYVLPVAAPGGAQAPFVAGPARHREAARAATRRALSRRSERTTVGKTHPTPWRAVHHAAWSSTHEAFVGSRISVAAALPYLLSRWPRLRHPRTASGCRKVGSAVRRTRQPRRHACPQCGTRNVYRAYRLSVLEKVVGHLTRRRIYVCVACHRRFYDRPSAA
jgi:hypothetical protein